MKKIYLILTLFIVSLFIRVYSNPDDLNRYFIAAAKKAKESVVNIIIYNRYLKNNSPQYKKVAYGSGTIIGKGYIVTNYHVVTKGNYYEIKNNEGDKLSVERYDNGMFYLADPKTDIAVLKIKKSYNMDLKPIKFEDSKNLSEGEWVLAIGNPYGLGLSITGGIVSSKGRDNLGFADIENFIQTDVPINPGNSGGPLVNLKGRLVGINTAIRSVSGGYQGISFAIPSNIIRQVCRELIKHGRVRRGWIGFIIKEVKEGNRQKSHVKIISVIKRSPADVSGLKKDDIIRRINDKKIYTLGSLLHLIGNKPVGSKIYLSVSRDGRLHDYSIILREKRVYKKIQKVLKKLFSRYGIEIDENAETGDVIISYVSPKGISYNLKHGDKILSVNGKHIESLDNFIKMFNHYHYKIAKMKIIRESRLYNIQFGK